MNLNLILKFIIKVAIKKELKQILFPLTPQIKFQINKIEVFTSQARIWADSRYSEFRSCPLGGKGTKIIFSKYKLDIQKIKIDRLQKSDNLQNWDLYFKNTIYSWKKNPWIWIIDFEKYPLPNKNFCENQIEKKNFNFIKAA